MTTDTEPKKEYNIFRDSLLRYMGYANELGESFRYQFPKLIIPSYVVAFSYCATDAFVTGSKFFEQSKIKSIVTFSDVLLWHTLASVFIPGGVINLAVKGARLALAGNLAGKMSYVPTAVGLGCIPFIIHPIDHGVNTLFDEVIRPVYPKIYEMAGVEETATEVIITETHEPVVKDKNI